jgi:hypothetical protein
MRLRRSLLNTRYSMKSNKYFSSNGISDFFKNSKEEADFLVSPIGGILRTLLKLYFSKKY